MIMKKISLAFFTGILFILTGCSDAIEIEQPGRLDAEAAYRSVSDLESGLLGLYGQIDLSGEIIFNALYTDMLGIAPTNGGQGLSEYAFNLNPASEAPAVFWIQNYGIINSATRLIEAGKNIQPGEGEVTEYNNIIGQAYALRAFAHFQLQSYFSTDYADDSALGVIAVDFIPSIDDQLLRNTNGEVFALIQSDLDQAESLLTVESAATFVSEDFVTALRARMAAYRRNYEAAAQYSKTLLDKYGLATPEEYRAIFKDQSNEEIIFKLERTVGDAYDSQGNTGSIAHGGTLGSLFAFTAAGIDGGAYYDMSRSLFNELDPEDVRYDVLLHDEAVIDPNYPEAEGFREDDVLLIGKYSGSEGIPLMNDIKVFRSAEMLLILAEAYAAMGDINGDANSTASLIKRLRDIRFGEDTALPVFANQTEAFAAILEQRRIELAYEGHRWKDVKRLGERANVQVIKDPLDCAINGACTLAPTDYRFTLPLPIVEFNANPGLREQQNPGY